MSKFDLGSVWQEQGMWFVRPPGCPKHMVANLKEHDVIDHGEGRLTVSPSILIKDSHHHRWHGYLKHGLFVKLNDSNIGGVTMSANKTVSVITTGDIYVNKESGQKVSVESYDPSRKLVGIDLGGIIATIPQNRFEKIYTKKETVCS